MRIAWLGAASLLVECEEGSLLFDPYLKALSEGLSACKKKLLISWWTGKQAPPPWSLSPVFA